MRQRREIRPAVIVSTMILASALGPASLARAAATDAETRVTYLAGNSVYVEAGRAEGLAIGDTLTVMRGDAPLAVLQVAYISTHRASCTLLSAAAAPQIGDIVRFRAAPPQPAAVPPGGAQDSAAAARPLERAPVPRQSSRPFRGRVGGRFFGAQSRSSGSFSEVGLDLRFDGRDLGTWPLDLAVDIRSRRSTYSTIGGDPSAAASMRVYRLSASIHGRESNRRVTVGRQSSTALGAVSLFDGALAEFGGERWTAGAFSGTQPDPEGLGVSGQIVEYGAYAEWRQPPGATRRWSFVGGAVASYESGELNRDFIFVQGYYRDERFALSLAQEVDVNYGWKTAAGDPAIMPSNTFINGRTQLSRALVLDTGYDNRRNVRLYRDRDTPATEFDDRTRQGVWAGMSARAGGHVTLGGNVRFHGDGSDAGRGHSWSVSGDVVRLVPWGTRTGIRWSRFSGDRMDSRLLGVALGFAPMRTLGVELSGGRRITADLITASEEQELWESADVDLNLGHRLLMTVGLEHIHGTIDRRFEEQVGLSWQF